MATKRQLLVQLQKRKTKQRITIITNIRVVTKKILIIMRQHIGVERRISKLNLFRQVFNINPEEVSEQQEWFMWELIKRAMHNCRKYTKCFIVSKIFPYSIYSSKKQGMYCYWVANTMDDVKTYVDNLEKNIKAMRGMEVKCARSVKNRWYNEEWEWK